MAALVLLLIPGCLFATATCLVRGRPGMPDLFDPAHWPLHLVLIALAGTAATAAGVADWIFHRRGGRVVSRAERTAEASALALGVPLFGFLCAASVAPRPYPFLVPILITALAMSALIAFDETRFHRLCGAVETLLHRVLVFGNGVAFLAWVDWCFRVRCAHA